MGSVNYKAFLHCPHCNLVSILFVVPACHWPVLDGVDQLWSFFALSSVHTLSSATELASKLNFSFLLQHLAIDPRSPSTGVNRTPIVVESPLLASADSDTPKKAPEVRPPKRGVFAINELLASQWNPRIEISPFKRIANWKVVVSYWIECILIDIW